MMTRRALVLANGELDDLAVLKARLAGWKDALVIAADGGSRHADALGLRPNVIVGDLDSFDPVALGLPADLRVRLPESGDGKIPAVLEVEGIQFVIVSPHKNETDLEIALQVASSRGAHPVAMLGATGGRLDMTIANVQMLLNPLVVGLQAEVWSGNQTARAILPPGATLHGAHGDTLSLIPLTPEAVGITSIGLEYPLKDEPLFACFPRGVSNVFTGAEARIDVREGALLAIHTPGRA